MIHEIDCRTIAQHVMCFFFPEPKPIDKSQPSHVATIYHDNHLDVEYRKRYKKESMPCFISRPPLSGKKFHFFFLLKKKKKGTPPPQPIQMTDQPPKAIQDKAKPE